MTRRRSSMFVDPAQRSFFDPPRVPLAGFGLAVRDALTEVLASARDRKGMDRHDVATALSRLDPDREVSKHMLDRYCAASAGDWRLPAELVPALYHVTEDPRLITLLAEACDHKAMPSEAAALGELMMIEMQERRLKERKRALTRGLPNEAVDWAAREAARRSGR